MCSLFSAGSNARGQLSHGSEDDSHTFRQCSFDGVGQQWPSGSKFRAVAAGANHTLVLMQVPNGKIQLWGCGDNRRGQIGSTFPLNSSTFQRIRLDHILSRFGDGEIKMMAAAWETSFIVMEFADEDRLFSAGVNDFGDLGTGSLQKEAKEWQQIRLRQLCPNDVSDIRISSLRAGPHTIIVNAQYVNGGSQEHLSAGWGASRHGQLGDLSSFATQRLPNFIPSPAPLALPEDIVDFAIGNQHSVFCTALREVHCLGSNRKGQIGGLGAIRDVHAVRATWNSTYVLQRRINDEGGWSVLKSGGSNAPVGPSSSVTERPTGSLEEVSFPDSVRSAQFLGLVCGSEHNLAHVKSGRQSEVYGWGWNEHGNLGLGHTDDVTAPIRVWPCEQMHKGQASGIWAGCATSWIAVED